MNISRTPTAVACTVASSLRCARCALVNVEVTREEQNSVSCIVFPLITRILQGAAPHTTVQLHSHVLQRAASQCDCRVTFSEVLLRELDACEVSLHIWAEGVPRRAQLAACVDKDRADPRAVAVDVPATVGLGWVGR